LARARNRCAGRSGRGAAQKRSNCSASRHIVSAPWTPSPSPAAFKTCLWDSDRVDVQDRCWPGLTPSSSVMAGGGRDHKPSRGRCRSTTEGIPRFRCGTSRRQRQRQPLQGLRAGDQKEPAHENNNPDDAASWSTKALATTRIQKQQPD